MSLPIFDPTPFLGRDDDKRPIDSSAEGTCLLARRLARSVVDAVTTLAALQSLVAKGESETLELKRSTAELKRAGETLCTFLNSEGGNVLIGVGPDGRLVGQDVADITLRDIAAILGRFEPPARVEKCRVDVGHGRGR